MSSLKYWIWLATRTGIGPSRARQLLDHFGTPERVYCAGRSDYLDIERIKAADIKELMDKDTGEAENILASCSGIGCRTITLHDSEYPDRLRNIYDPPIVLYLRGVLPLLDDLAVVGVVGTRKCTPYGIKTAENVGYGLSHSGIIVVTGLAKGVDTAATLGALKGGAPVIGVIGSGLDIIYPPENKQVFNDVASFGALISEYPPGTMPLPGHFPARNRIISGISLGVAVIEAPKRSGALITAAQALEQGRDVFALPGNVDAATCEGSNALLRDGAIPFMTADDIIDEYTELYSINKQTSNDKETKISFDNIPKVDYIDKRIPGDVHFDKLIEDLSGDEKQVAESIGQTALQVDEIISCTKLPAKQVLTALTMLELSGHAQKDKSGKWEIIIDGRQV